MYLLFKQKSNQNKKYLTLAKAKLSHLKIKMKSKLKEIETKF
jgi:hypothetical protein